MRQTGTWMAFLATLFALVGLCGMFASYAAGVPLERAIARLAVLDEAAMASGSQASLEGLRPRLASLGALVLDGPGPVPERIAAARRTVREEARREEASVTHRTRLMLGVVTLLAAGLGAGMIELVRRESSRRPSFEAKSG